MKCELCKNAEATIHLTQVVDGAVKKVHFCEACAAQSGFDVHGPMSITDILLNMGGAPAEPKAVRATDRSCPKCHMRRVDFKKTGRLGCPSCYVTFADELTPLLKVMHHDERHKGKLPRRVGESIRRDEERRALEQRLEQAIVDENYEEAARLRDVLKSGRPRRKSGKTS